MKSIGLERDRKLEIIVENGDLVPRGSLSNPGKKNLGTSALIEPGGKADLVNVTGDDDTAIVLSVTLTKNETISFSPGPVVGWPYASISWGNAGVSTEMEIDVINGINFPLPCSFLRITAFNPIGTFGPVKIGAFVTYLPVPRPLKRLKRSFVVPAIPPATLTPYFPIPSFAGDVIFQRTNGQSFRLHFFDRNENELYWSDTAFGENMNPIELAASVAGIKIENTSFAQADAGLLIFGLEI